MKVTYRGHTQARDCSDCGSSHIGPVPCGRTFRSRLRSVRLDPAATPSRERVAYYDDEPFKEVFGEDRKTRKARFMDDTKGHGSLGKSNDPTAFKEVMGFDPTKPEMGLDD